MLSLLSFKLVRLLIGFALMRPISVVCLLLCSVSLDFSCSCHPVTQVSHLFQNTFVVCWFHIDAKFTFGSTVLCLLFLYTLLYLNGFRNWNESKTIDTATSPKNLCQKKVKKEQNIKCNVIRKRLLNLHCYNSSGLLLECFGQFTVLFSSTIWWQPSSSEAMQEAQFEFVHCLQNVVQALQR